MLMPDGGMWGGICAEMERAQRRRAARKSGCPLPVWDLVRFANVLQFIGGNSNEAPNKLFLTLFFGFPFAVAADGFPLAGASGFQDGVANVLSFERVPESGAGEFVFGERFDEVGDLVNEAMFVADLQAGHPPFAHVRMITIGDVQI